jgi:hypothetical protein
LVALVAIFLDRIVAISRKSNHLSIEKGTCLIRYDTV